MNKFGDLIRSKRENNNMLLRHLASDLDIDTGMLSKIERGEKLAKREQITQLAELFKLDERELLSFWLADQVYNLVGDEKDALTVIKLVEQELKNDK
ncbi:helix-turn-helix transcriptional regulator [Bacteroides sp.]|uniref:helix-turn-helix domain-containing protein n=1 Tax=Bacteroides sp. TaxID=29523 RepID=UPI002582C3D1|nr:helix-turn-helix transcriptional regulator [Bacteroides sp.]